MHFYTFLGSSLSHVPYQVGKGCTLSYIFWHIRYALSRVLWLWVSISIQFIFFHIPIWTIFSFSSYELKGLLSDDTTHSWHSLEMLFSNTYNLQLRLLPGVLGFIGLKCNGFKLLEITYCTYFACIAYLWWWHWYCAWFI